MPRGTKLPSAPCVVTSIGTMLDARRARLLFLRRGRSLSISRQCDQREVLSIHVVHQVEHARKAGAGVQLLVPGAIAPLSLQHVSDPARQRIATGVVTPTQTHNRPPR